VYFLEVNKQFKKLAGQNCFQQSISYEKLVALSTFSGVSDQGRGSDQAYGATFHYSHIQEILRENFVVKIRTF